MNKCLAVVKKAPLKRLLLFFVFSLLLCVILLSFLCVNVQAAGVTIDVNAGDTEGNIGALEVMIIFSFLALLPSIVLMMTSFTRIVIVLSFLRNAMGTAQAPPNMVLVGLAIFLSLFIMTPTITEMNDVAYQPYLNGDITSTEAITEAAMPLKKFMLTQTYEKNLSLFLELSGTEMPVADTQNDPEAFRTQLTQLPITVLVPAFITSELSRAFMMGFLIFLPFLIIDLVVSSILMSMGMMMLPPSMISLPFKLLLFVLVDGWSLMMKTLVDSFAMAVT